MHFRVSAAARPWADMGGGFRKLGLILGPLYRMLLFGVLYYGSLLSESSGCRERAWGGVKTRQLASLFFFWGGFRV